MKKFWDFKEKVKIVRVGEPMPSFRRVSAEEAERIKNHKPKCHICEALRARGEKLAAPVQYEDEQQGG